MLVRFTHQVAVCLPLTDSTHCPPQIDKFDFSPSTALLASLNDAPYPLYGFCRYTGFLRAIFSYLNNKKSVISSKQCRNKNKESAFIYSGTNNRSIHFVQPFKETWHFNDTEEIKIVYNCVCKVVCLRTALYKTMTHFPSQTLYSILRQCSVAFWQISSFLFYKQNQCEQFLLKPDSLKKRVELP